jgi:hypothetical protein
MENWHDRVFVVFSPVCDHDDYCLHLAPKVMEKWRDGDQ